MPRLPERPIGVRVGLAAFVVYAASVVVAVLIVGLGEFVDRRLRTHPPRTPESMNPVLFAEFVRTSALVLLPLVLVAYLLFCWAAWRGDNWARVVLWIWAAVTVASSLSAVRPLLTGASPVLPTTPLGVVALLALPAGAVLLATPPSNAWYRRAKQNRTAEPTVVRATDTGL